MAIEHIDYNMDPNDTGMDKIEEIEGITTKKKAAQEQAKAQPAQMKNADGTVGFDTFAALDMRVAKILDVEDVPGARKPMYKLRIDVGELGERHIVAGIGAFYSKDELVGRKIVIVANLAPRSIAGQISQGMLLAAEYGDEVSILQPDRDMKEGSRIG